VVIQFTINGTGGTGETWQTAGEVEAEWHKAFDVAMRASFEQLTHGKAVYGNPGKGGCRGPYKISRVELVAR
jgi:hypothetical protein